jgi:soluble cytochrome b562
MSARRLNVSLDKERSEKLAHLADRAHVPDGTLARSLLSAAIDDADPDAASVTDILEGIPGLAPRLDQAEAQVDAGAVEELRDL